MNKDTKERINYYRDYLPKMKEKLFGAALMFIISALMMSSATFAWITLSASPQVMSIDTTVAANGNLEIALSKPDGSAPGKSAAGDSSAAEGTPVTRANLTWGNLINLTDPSYGLSKVVLRPAALRGNTGLLSSPLYGVGYGADGRVEQMTTTDDFAYVYFDNDKMEFMADLEAKHLGVRAVSTVQYIDLGSGNVFSEYKKSVDRATNEAKNSYAGMTSETQSPGKEYIASLQGLIQAYAQSTIDGGLNEMDITEYVPDLYRMMCDFDSGVMEKCGQAYLDMAHMLFYQENGANVTFTYTVDSLCSDALSNKLPSYINIEYLQEFAKDRRQLKAYLAGTEETFPTFTAAQKNNNFAYHAWSANNGGKVLWKDLSGAINWLVDTATCTVDGYNMSSLKSNAMKIINNKTHTAVITKGALYRAEQRIGQKMSPVISITIDASKIMSFIGKQTLNNITVSTAAEDKEDDPFRIPYDLQATLDKCGGAVRGNDAVAEDTYAMAIDFWLRTNAGSRGAEPETTTTVEADEEGNEITTTVIKSAEIPFVTLEGSVRTEKTEVDVKVKDINGVEQSAYTLSGTFNGEPLSVDGYMRDGKYYYIDSETGEEVNLSQLAEDNGVAVSATPKKEIKTNIIGYDGVNRVWTDDQMAEFTGEGTSTTQGGGSCYVFYANSESDQKRFLDLLTAMNVIFIDGNGKKIGAAVMDTENYFAQNGKVTVPLAVEKTADNYLDTDINAKDIYSICQLEKGVAKRITALVYLDGTKLSNDMVLASGDIQGTLNIQFSSIGASKVTTIQTDADGNEISNVVSYEIGGKSLSIKNDELMDDRITVSADATVKSFEYDPANPATTTVEVTVGGIDPAAVSASFIRAVNSTQGSLQPSFALTKNGDKWTAEYTFNKPGTYILRTVWIDGAEYELSAPVTVEVTGMEVNSLVCDSIKDGGRSASILTAATSFAAKIDFGFADSKGVPSSVNGIFLDEDGNEVNVAMNVDKDGTLWSGSARFTSSGRYTMKYYTVDGDLYELPESMWITLDIQLGLKVQTWISCSDETLAELQKENPNASANSFKLMPDQTVTLEISAKVFDNNGNSIDGLADVKILYGRSGSSMDSKGLDSDLKWNAERQRYVGSFLVKEAGTYRFTRVSVGSNSITSYTNAPSVQAMPPEDVAYYNNLTEEYQFSPKKDAKMVLGLAYSSAATKVEATVTNGVVTETASGTVGGIIENTGKDVVNEWSFDIPKDAEGLQEGRWTLNDITLYGVYYNGAYYGDENGITINLASENVHAKVVNNIHVTLDSQTASKEFTGYFMDEHKVSGSTVTIADYEGQAIQGLNVSDVKVMYLLDHTNVSLDTYGYTADGLENVNISSEGTLKSGSTTEYAMEDFSFRYAGAYNKCEISFAEGGKTYNAGITDGTVMHYRIAGYPAESFPTYEVKWIAPTLKVTSVDPNPSTTFKINPGSRSTTTRVTGHNFISPDGFYARLSADGTNASTFTAPKWSKATIELKDAGQNFTNASFTVTAEVEGTHYDADYSYTPGSVSVTKEIGGGGLSSALARAGYQKFEAIDMQYGGKTFTVKLSHMLAINGVDTAIPTFSYSAGDYESFGVKVPAEKHESPYPSTPADLRKLNELTLAAIDDAYASFTDTYEEAGELDSTKTQKDEKTETAYYEGSEGSGCNKKTVYFPYTVKTVVEKTPASKNTYNATYDFAGWTITQTNQQTGAETQYGGGRTYAAGAKLYLEAANTDYSATPVYNVGDKVFVSSVEQNYVVTTVTVTAGTKTETKPNGTKYNSAGDITNLAGTTEGWE